MLVWYDGACPPIQFEPAATEERIPAGLVAAGGVARPELPFDTEGGCHVIIQVLDKGPGWVVFRPGVPAPAPDRLPLRLSQALEQWLVERPQARVRQVLGIVADGNTSVVHLWYDTPPGQ